MASGSDLACVEYDDLLTPKTLKNCTDEDLLGIIKGEHYLFASSWQRALNCGNALLEVKSRCNHGEFGAWCKQWLPFSYRTAKVYMQVAKRQNSALLPLTPEDSELTISAALGAAARAKPTSTPGKGAEPSPSDPPESPAPDPVHSQRGAAAATSLLPAKDITNPGGSTPPPTPQPQRVAAASPCAPTQPSSKSDTGQGIPRSAGRPTLTDCWQVAPDWDSAPQPGSGRECKLSPEERLAARLTWAWREAGNQISRYPDGDPRSDAIESILRELQSIIARWLAACGVAP